MATVSMKAKRRESAGKGAARKLRARNLLPSVLYGEGIPGWPIAVEVRDLEKLFQGGRAETTIIDLEVEGEESGPRKSIIREVQRDPISGKIRHVDFQHISLKKKITVVVPIALTGVAPGVKTSGGILDHSLREVEVRCFPDAIPEEIKVDISALQIGDSIHVEDIESEGLEIMTEPDRTVVGVAAPAVYEEEKPAEEEAAEPEVVEKGKKEEAAEAEETPPEKEKEEEEK